jgi:parvulin-like peptidyl-prolyl isomerase
MPKPQKPIRKNTSRNIKGAPQPTKPQIKKKPILNKTAITIASIALVVALVAGTFYYLVAVMPYQRTILTVEKDNIKTGYFLKRIVANPNNPDTTTALQNLTAELIIKQKAPGLGVATVTAQDIDTFMRDLAKGTNDTISDTDYNTWFKERVLNSGLSTKEYREVAAREIQRQRLIDLLSGNISSVTPQIHLWAIVLNTEADALKAKAKIDGGEDFATVAKDVSIDTTVQENGGDMGWLPPDVLNSQLSSAVSTLEVGKCSDPVAYAQQDSTSSTGSTTSYVLLMMSEKSDAMEITSDQLTVLKYKALTEWLNTQASAMKISVHGLNNSTYIDTQTSSWIDFQVQKLKAKLSSKLAKITPSSTSTSTSTPTTPTTTSTTTTPTTTPTTGGTSP